MDPNPGGWGMKMKDKPVIDARNRNKLLEQLEYEPFDVLVIGAGITGCGIARDTAMRGLKTLLIDAGDIASGTSSRSSKLIHGGLRYLAQGQIGVVREAARERRTLRRIAPHLSLTNPMVVLAHSKKSIGVLKTAMWTFEKMGGVDKHERHVVWDSKGLLSNEPSVQSDHFEGAVVYPEYLTDDARLTLANARSAAAYGATVANYVAAEKILLENGKAAGAILRDTTGKEKDTFRVKAKKVINAAGPWVDIVRKLENPKAKDKLQLTKGIHVVVSRARLPIQNTVCWAASDSRGLFAVPRGRVVYIGTTDTFFKDPTYWPEITKEDVRYLVDSANGVFSIDPITDRDIVALWSGIRPLLGAKGKKPSEISRRNEVLEGPGGMLTVAGGKLTSYRSMAERVADQCQKDLGRTPTASRTAEEPLPGGDFAGSFDDLKSKINGLGLTDIEAERAARLYGSDALDIFGRNGGPDVEAAFAVTHEGAVTLEDYWVRRSARIYFDDNNGIDALLPASEKMAEILGWTEDERLQQVEICRKKSKDIFKVLDSK
jgi:glycerol-3-phosphate dehydrogenase